MGKFMIKDKTTLIEGDCLAMMSSLAAKSVDMVLCDLPYGTTNCRWDTPVDLEKLWEQYNRICSGPIILFAQTPFDKVLGCSNLKDLRYEWIWEKTNPTGHLNAKKSPMKAHENILVFYKKQPHYTPQITNGHIRKVANRKKVDNCEIYGKQTFHAPYDSINRYPRSVIIFPSDKQKQNLHPTQKPVALCEYMIQTYSKDGQTIMDNCMGSGTTGVAAKRLQRKFIGIELEPKYFQIAKQRIEETYV